MVKSSLEGCQKVNHLSSGGIVRKVLLNLMNLLVHHQSKPLGYPIALNGLRKKIFEGLLREDVKRLFSLGAGSFEPGKAFFDARGLLNRNSVQNGLREPANK